MNLKKEILEMIKKNEGEKYIKKKIKRGLQSSKIDKDQESELLELMENRPSSISLAAIKNALVNHNYNYISTKINVYFPMIIEKGFLNFNIIKMSTDNNVMNAKNVKDLTNILKKEVFTFIFANEKLLDMLDRFNVSEKAIIIEALNKIEEKEITEANAKDYLLELINRIPEILRYANENNISWSSKDEINDLNKTFAEFKNIELIEEFTNKEFNDLYLANETVKNSVSATKSNT